MLLGSAILSASIMDRLRHIGNILSPSVSSSAVGIVMAGAVYAVVIFSTSIGNGTIYDWLLGPHSSAGQIQKAHGTFAALSTTILGNNILNQVLFFGMWVLVGIAVYVVLIILGHEFSELHHMQQDFGYANARLSQVMAYHGLRLFIRSIVLAGWGLYWLFFVRIFVPFSLLCAHIGSGQLGTVTGWLYAVAGFLVLVVTLHLHLVFMRLLLLRTRLFDEQ